MPGLGSTQEEMMQSGPIPQQQPAPAGQPPMGLGAQPAMPGGLDDEPEMATPEEQEMYDSFVSMALIALYDDNTLEVAKKMVAEAPDPIDAVAALASSVTTRVLNEAQENGKEISGEILLNGGKEIVEAAIEVVESITETEFDDAMMQQAFFASADMFRENIAGMGTYGDDVREQDGQELAQMAQSGGLEKIMAKRQQMEGQPQQQQAPAVPPMPDQGMM